MSWEPEVYKIASFAGPHPVAGYVYRGLGLHIRVSASPKGRKPPTWTLTHLNTGHSICNLTGKVADVFPVAAEVAECGDWTFEGLHGWKNMDPELGFRTKAIAEKHPGVCAYRHGVTSDEKIAREIAAERTA